jgi:GT2 family glycosyltransferase
MPGSHAQGNAHQATAGNRPFYDGHFRTPRLDTLVPVSDAPSYDFSIVVPTRNRPLHLARCLGSLAVLDYPADRFEVIVVDDGGDVPIDVATAARLGAIRFSPLRKAHAGPAAARNHGAAHAQGRFLAFTDDDCTPAPGWLRALKDHFDRSPHDLAGGRWVNALGQNVYSAACHTIVDAAYEYYDPARGRAHFFASSNFAMATEKFRALGGFDPKWTLAAADDREFCFRWLQRGFQMAYVPEAVVFHHHAHTWTTYCKLHFRYGRGAYYYHAQRTAAGVSTGLEPAWKFYWACFRHPFTHLRPARAIAISFLLVAWQFANAAGYFRESMKRA